MSDVVRDHDRLIGTWQQPENRWADLPNSIHNDAVATKIGMRGGTIPGTVHLGHFVPLIRDLFGDRWWHEGSISMFYTFATTHREDVRAVIKVPEAAIGDRDVQLDAWVENTEAKVVAKGTIAVGQPDAVPYVRSLPLENAKPGANRILANLHVGAEIPPKDDVVMKEGGVDGILLNAATMYGPLNAGFPKGSIAPAVGFFGATEIVLRHGPIRTGPRYRRTGRVVCVGDSPKTEFAWVDSALHDERGVLIAEMRHLTRWMKASSPLWKA